MKNRRWTGYLLALLGGCAYGLNPLFAKPLYAAGFSPVDVLVARYALATVLFGAFLAVRDRRSLAVPIRSLPTLAYLGLMLGLCSIGLFEAYRIMDVGLAATLNFVYPAFVALIMAACYRQRPNRTTLGALALVLVGVALLGRDGRGVPVRWEGIALSAMSALTYAVYMVAVCKSRVRTLDSGVLVFFTMLAGTAVMALYGAVRGGVRLDFGGTGWLNLFGLALFPSLGSFVATTAAIKRVGPTPTAVFGAFEPITSTLLGICLYGEVLTLRTGAGTALVLAAVTSIIVSDRKT